LITRLDFDAKNSSDEAGIRIINGKENLFVKLYSSADSNGHKIIGFSFDKTYYKGSNKIGNVVWLKLERINHILKGFYGTDGTTWTMVGEQIDVASLDNYNVDYNGWSGNRQGLYVQGRSADFDLYIYRDAYTPILAECPANQFGTTRSGSETTGYTLDDIHHNDWALYAGVEFGGNEYSRIAHKVQFEVSNVTNGSQIEVWLDSVDTGKKIASCKVNGAGNKSGFQTFSAKTTPTIGRHDVYLKFVGKTTSKLFVLKSLVFISDNT
jgi:hypothetical protein